MKTQLDRLGVGRSRILLTSTWEIIRPCTASRQAINNTKFSSPISCFIANWHCAKQNWTRELGPKNKPYVILFYQETPWIHTKIIHHRSLELDLGEKKKRVGNEHFRNLQKQKNKYVKCDCWFSEIKTFQSNQAQEMIDLKERFFMHYLSYTNEVNMIFVPMTK